MCDITIKALTSNIIKRYDRNQDGKINIPKNIVDVPGAFNTEKEEKSAENTFKADETKVSVIATSKTNIKIVNMETLFKDADADGNGDGQVTRQELENELKTFDQNHNGIIGTEKVKGSSKSEIEVLKDSYPEEKNTESE